MFEIELIISIKMDLELNNLQRLICHKTQTTNQQGLNEVEFSITLSSSSSSSWDDSTDSHESLLPPVPISHAS